MNQLEIEDCNSQHKSLSQLDFTSSVNLLPMTIDRTRVRKAERREEMERTRHRVNLESKDLLILDIILENPQGWRGSA